MPSYLCDALPCRHEDLAQAKPSVIRWAATHILRDWPNGIRAKLHLFVTLAKRDVSECSRGTLVPQSLDVKDRGPRQLAAYLSFTSWICMVEAIITWIGKVNVTRLALGTFIHGGHLPEKCLGVLVGHLSVPQISVCFAVETLCKEMRLTPACLQ